MPGPVFGASRSLDQPAEAEKRMFAKLAAPRFLTNIRRCWRPTWRRTDQAAPEAIIAVFRKLVALIPGGSWTGTPEKLKPFKFEETGSAAT